MKSIFRKLSIIFALVPFVTRQLNNGAAPTPAMGWNSWQTHGIDINDEIVQEAGNQLGNLGLNSLGYVYVTIGDGWQLPERDAYDHIIIDRTRFAQGITPVAQYIHNLNLKFGIYSTASTKTCTSRVGSLGQEVNDAGDFAEWGVDYLTYGNCFSEGGSTAQTRFNQMRDALNKTGRTIYYAMNNGGFENVWLWGNQTANSWRTISSDAIDWASMKQNYRTNSLHPESAGSGNWNDPGQLIVGLGILNNVEEKTHFAIWCFAKAPLILGASLKKISQSTLTIIKNKNLIAVNQDQLGLQAKCVQGCNTDLEVYGSKNKDTDGEYFAALAVNWNDQKSSSVAIDLVLIGAANSPKTYCNIYELWTKQYWGRVQGLLNTPLISSHDHFALYIKCDQQAANVNFL